MEDPQEQVCVRYAYRTRTIRAPKCTVRGFGFSRVDFRRGSPGGARVRRRGCHFWRFRCVDHPPGGGRVGTPQELLLRASGAGPAALDGRPTTTPIFFQGSSKYFLKNLFQDSNPPPPPEKGIFSKRFLFWNPGYQKHRRSPGGRPPGASLRTVRVPYAHPNVRYADLGSPGWTSGEVPQGAPGCAGAGATFGDFDAPKPHPTAPPPRWLGLK